MIKGIEHIGLAANNPAKLVKWYQDNLSMELAFKENDECFFIKAPCGSIIEVYKSEKNSHDKDNNMATGWRHLAIEVEDFDIEHQKLLNNGTQQVGNLISNDVKKLVLFKDCEGNLFHLIQRPKSQ